jgi:hypothetical protein
MSRRSYFFLWKKRKSSIIDSIFWTVLQKITAAVKRIKFVSDMMSCIVLRGQWCDIIILNVRTTTEDKKHDIKDSFYVKLQQVFCHFPKYH